MADKNWIEKLKKGSLRKATHTPAGKNIPKKTINADAKKGGKIGKMANAAKTLAKLRK